MSEDRNRPGAEEVGPDDPLRALFAGKRAWPRREVLRRVVVQGLRASYAGQVVNLSRRGVLVAIVDPGFYAAEGDGIARIEGAFPDGLDLLFPDDGLGVLATVVRVVPHGSGRIAVGCRLLRDLSSAEALLLGLRAAELGVPEALEERLPLHDLPTPPLSLALEPASEGAPPGPAFSGHVLGVGERTVDATAVTLAAPEVVARAYADAPVRVVFRSGRRRVAVAQGQLAACFREPDGGRTHVRVVLDGSVPDAVLDGLGPRG